MKIIYFGSGPFAVPALERLASLQALGQPAQLLLVVSRPDRPAGRGQKSTSTPVSAFANERHLPLEIPESANHPDFLRRLQSLQADLFLVADYGEFLGRSFRALPRLGAYNLHASILPKYRGAAPVVHALMNGETTTGVTFFRIEKSMDGGPIVDALSLPIDPLETAGELEARLAIAAADLLEKVLPRFIAGTVAERPQDESPASFAPKILKEQGSIDWRASAAAITNLARAMNPWPGAYSHLARKASGPPERVKILRLRPVESSLAPDSPESNREGQPGKIFSDGKNNMRVACGSGMVELVEIQRAGKTALNIVEFLRGWKAQPGDYFRST